MLSVALAMPRHDSPVGRVPHHLHFYNRTPKAEGAGRLPGVHAAYLQVHVHRLTRRFLNDYEMSGT